MSDLRERFRAVLAPYLAELLEASERACRECGCTDLNCSKCIERTGEPCMWVEDDLCSACAGVPIWPDREYVTPEQLAEERASGLEALREGLGREGPITFTCDSCGHAARCLLAFDPYCTDGECLADK